jgi:sugar O-acyltransferase (sialic acid O-acetyltransferase NeuD family)|tara:strand:- start:8022 stop:8663 length:642 start_codon:yes stop_codon:yes gene_type:complete
MKKLAMLGAGGLGKTAADAALLNGWDSVLFFDDDDALKDRLGPMKSHGNTSYLIANLSNFDGVHVSIGNNKDRRQKFLELDKTSAPIVSIIHPTAVICKTAKIEDGSLLLANTTLNSSALIGRGVIMSHATGIDHDCNIGDFVLFSPACNLAGAVNVGNDVTIGIGSIFINNINVGDRAIIGAGSVVTSDIPSDTLSYGVPCKVSKKLVHELS